MELPFKIADSVIAGLRFLNQIINEEITKKLIVNAVKQLLVKGPGKEKSFSLNFLSFTTIF